MKRTAIGIVIGLASCAPMDATSPRQASPSLSASATSEATLPPPVAKPELVTGSFPAATREPLSLVAKQFFRGAGFDVLGLPLPLSGSDTGAVRWVRLPEGGVGVATTGVLFADGGIEGPALWLFVPRKAAAVRGTLLLEQDGRAGALVPFVTAESRPRSDRQALQRFADLAADWYRSVETPYHQFAAFRLQTAFGVRAATSSSDRVIRATDLLEKVMLEQSRLWVQKQDAYLDPMALLALQSAKRTIDQKTLLAPERYSVPFEAWASKSAGVTLANAEPLASRAPNDFFYLRAETPKALLALVDDTELLAVRRRLGLSEPFAYDLTDRYLAQLGLSREAVEVLTRGVVSEVALVGSDVAFEQGTDLTLLLRVSDRTVFDEALTSVATSRGLAPMTTLPAERLQDPTFDPLPIHTRSLGDGEAAQYALSLDETVALSNSRTAIEHLRRVWLGHSPSLEQDASFKHLWGGPRKPGQALFFFGDAFIERYDGLERRIQRGRAFVAATELETLSYAQLLYQELLGRPPNDEKELRGLGLLQPGELSHSESGRIHFEVGAAAHSDLGTSRALRPLLDRPPLTKVSAIEAEAFERVKLRREVGDASFRGPLIADIGFTLQEGRVRDFTARVHTLPVSPEATAYANEVLGQGVQISGTGAGVVMGMRVSDGATPGLSSALSAMLGRDVDVGLLGVVAIGAQEDFRLAEVARSLGLAPEPGATGVVPDERLRLLATRGELPLYAVLRTRGEDHGILDRMLIAAGFAPSSDEELWGRPVVAWTFTRPGLCGAHACAVRAYSAERDGARFIALQRSTLAALLSEANVAEHHDPMTPNIVYQTRSEGSGPLQTLLEWTFERQRRSAERPSRALADTLFRMDSSPGKGSYAPLAQRLLGYVPVTPEGDLFEWLEDGINDPRRGTLASPVWPELPIEEETSPFVNWLGNAKVSVTFTREGTTKDGSVHGVVFDVEASAP